jgi:FkbM family methyltransferase
MSSRLDIIRPAFHALRRAGVDIQSPTRRDAANALTVQRRLFGESPVRTIFDCGAHHGRVAREYAAAFPEARVYSFEPTPATFEVLKTNVGDHDRITITNAAVGESEGTMNFYIAPFEQANSLLPRFPGQPEREQKVPVRVCRIDEFCRENGVDRIDILKLDIEGYEAPAIRGCGRLIDEQKIDVLYCETRFDSGGGINTTFPDLCALLLPRGYEFFGLFDPRYTSDLQFEWGDVMFVSRPRLAEYRGR